ncbi:adenylosuccinate lyase [Strigomonas culicis]|uniref:Adenylosuccinate lyase n=1 Tax=Strigomonas culicis TaxID=28005 RepID=S9UEK1_9TRYP|nr:adenylosuccinate lyase [Strigomonas culicis]EPY25728.1 adenylosuccinate lyase [Strigomonas culicis]EPY27114.1 adenylosuccinate lyase [Strigomonas culicis]|eukprot:EPY25728.1 adenylosuccinate lyase [Strigomonas culicis]
MSAPAPTTSHATVADVTVDNPLFALSPIDGRYKRSTAALRSYFSEFALFKYRVQVEVLYLQALHAHVPEIRAKMEAGGLTAAALQQLRANTFEHFTEADAARIKAFERETNHDIKAVEYYVKEKMGEVLGGAADAARDQVREWVHFGLTSQDINNTSIPMLLRDAVVNEVLPLLQQLETHLLTRITKGTAADAAAGTAAEAPWEQVPLLARTHGQPASPTTMGKEMYVFYTRLQAQREQLHGVLTTHWGGKFGGATGNLSAHKVAYPQHDWPQFATRFLRDDLCLRRQTCTTQVEHYDTIAALCDGLARLNRILVDLARDVWQYIAYNYFTQKVVKKEVGSSTMPHKVNPIDFENAEGNLLLANALLHFMSEKLPISRLQRDLTDSTVLRNLGVPLAHMLIAYHSLLRGMAKLTVSPDAMRKDLEENWAVVTEGIQTILRREGFDRPYEALKDLTRGREGSHITQAHIAAFIDQLFQEKKISAEVREELLALTPTNYIGYTWEDQESKL